ncbi:MAG: VOC family protein, partial [Bdellovibrionales bacterium]|nr:VOC family protein [Bdellovibrionales bacterium]
EQVLEVYRKHLDVEIQFLQDLENPLFKTEVLRFGGPDPEVALEALEADPKISELFARFMKDIVDPEMGKIEEQTLIANTLSDAGKLHHVEIYCSNLSRSKEFWTWFLDLLGYKIYQTWPDGISLKLGSTYLVFVQAVDKFKSHPYHRAQPGLNHLAFHASSRNQVDRLTAALGARGTKLLYQDKFPSAGGENTYGVFFEDPEGIKVEVVFNAE